MKETGVTRKLDELGRIVIPKEIRDNYKLEEGDEVEFYLNDNNIVIRKPSNLYGYDDEIYKLFQTYNQKVHNSLAIVENKEILLGYGKDLDTIDNCIKDINIDQYNSKNLTRCKNKDNNFIITNIEDNKYFILYEEKLSSSIDSTMINIMVDYIYKLIKQQ